MRKFIKDDFTWDAFDKLAQYGRTGERALSVISTLPTQKRTGSSSPIESLPIEIIDMIIADPCLEPIDVVSLGLSSHFSWIYVLQYIVQKCQKAPWANTPLLCTGSWTMSLPQAIHDIKPELKQQEEVFFKQSNQYGACPARKFNWGAISSFAERNEQHRGLVWTQAFSDLSGMSCIPAKDLKGLRRSLEAIIGPNQAKIPAGSLQRLRRSLEAVVNPIKSAMPAAWTLRNLTTKEYVSLKAGHTYRKNEYHVYVKGIPWLSVDRALLLRICWSSTCITEGDDYFNYDANGDEYAHLLAQMMRGKWAGDCFDIVPNNRESQAWEEAQGWCDVTSEIIKEAAAWRAVFK